MEKLEIQDLSLTIPCRAHACYGGLNEGANPPCHTLPAAPAAIVYTSGSAGTSKGTVQNHRTALSRAWKRASYNNLVTTDLTQTIAEMAALMTQHQAEQLDTVAVEQFLSSMEDRPNTVVQLRLY